MMRVEAKTNKKETKEFYRRLEDQVRAESREMVIGGVPLIKLEEQLGARGVIVDDFAEDMTHSETFDTLREPKIIKIVQLALERLRLPNYPTIKQLYERIQPLDFLKLCRAETGLHACIQNIGQPEFYIAMEPIFIGGGHPGIFRVVRDKSGLRLEGSRAGDDRDLRLTKDEFIFYVPSPQIN